MTVPLLLLGASYLLGSIPSSYWIGRLACGVDLRKEGSGNLGATNAYRTLGARVAVPVLVLDIVKGWAPVALFPLLVPAAAAGWAVAWGAAAIVGHVFSVWVGFRGGKGVATSAGVFLALAPWAALAALVVWLGAVLLTGYVSLGSILAAIVLPLALVLLPDPAPTFLVGFTVALALFVLWAHRGNAGRLLRGEERRFGRRGQAHMSRTGGGGAA